MTNDNFINGLIDIGVQKGYDIPDRYTNTEYEDKGMFTFLYSGDIIKLERGSRNKYFFTILPQRTYTKAGQQYHILKKTYEKAFKYFFEISDYGRLKKKLKKDIRKIKLNKIENEI